MSHRQRLSVIDAAKAFASQLIVAHHLCFYGPMSDLALPLAPALIAWIAEYGRYAVQVFLVVAGFLAARSLATEGHLHHGWDPARLVLQRFLRLAAPIPAVVLLAVASSALARQWLTHDTVPPAPEFLQLAAHLLLAHGVLGFDSLSAGLWYVAIDFQLYALLVALLWLGHAFVSPRREHRRHPGALLVLLLGLAAALGFNRVSELDDWGIYFFASYALGAFAWWSWAPRHPRLRKMTLLLVFGVGVALLWEWRDRLALALMVAVALRYLGRHGQLTRWGRARLLAWLADISYAVFLVHFSVLVLVSAVFSRFAAATPGVQLSGMLLAWMLSIAAGHAFHRHLELPLGRWITRHTQFRPSR